ncbi:MAG: VOC family protein [Thermomicrobiales bacterium]|nr:VOC family protein [Thermomicrobiales bacterium]
MRITQSAISLNVPHVERSAQFLETYFGFHRVMEAEGFVSLTRDDAGFHLIFLQVGLPTFKPDTHAAAAGPGLLIVFEVDDIDAEWTRLQDQELFFPTSIETESWGERYFQVLDPNGIIVQLVQWV